MRNEYSYKIGSTNRPVQFYVKKAVVVRERQRYVRTVLRADETFCGISADPTQYHKVSLLVRKWVKTCEHLKAATLASTRSEIGGRRSSTGVKRRDRLATVHPVSEA